MGRFTHRILICLESFVMLSTQEASDKKLFKHQIGFTFFSLYDAKLITFFNQYMQVYTLRRDIFNLTS